MYATYHLSSAEEVNTEILEAIKASFKSKPITIIVEEAEGEYLLSTAMKAELDSQLSETDENYISAATSIHLLKQKYGL